MHIQNQTIGVRRFHGQSMLACIVNHRLVILRSWAKFLCEFLGLKVLSIPGRSRVIKISQQLI